MNPETPPNPVPTPANPAVAKKPVPAVIKTPPAKPATDPVPKVPPFFRKVDWWTFAVTTLLIFTGYLLTISPDLTLEDSGELAVGSMYAGVPHPPGYPVWTIFTWIFTKLLPFSNIAWRVSVASAVAAALACGVLSLMVSRGSSMMIESIADLKGIERRWENAICAVSGFVSATLLAYNGYMWSQAVIVEVYPFSVLSLCLVICCLMRWMYAPHQRRYLYWAAFLFGICVTNHQTLVVAAMGVEIVVLAAQPKLGRDLLVVNCFFWFLGLLGKKAGFIHTFDSDPGKTNLVFVIFNVVGLSSLVGMAWLTLHTKRLLTEWKTVLIMASLCIFGACFYFYMPLASMSNPPMNWGYPRTPEGFFHALSRGQYEKTNPTDFIHDPMRLIQQTGLYFEGASEEFTLVYLLIAIVPFVFFLRMQRRERAWMVGLSGIYLCLAFLLMILLNPSPDRQSRSLIKVFFTSSYVPIAMWIGYGLTLTAAWLITQYQRARFWVLCGGAFACMVAFYELLETIKNNFKDAPTEGWKAGFKIFAFGANHLFSRGLGALPVWGSLLVLIFALIFLSVLFISRQRIRLGVILTLFTCMPLSSILSHWADNEERGHLFGFWFGHDMFTPPFPGTDGKLTYDKRVREQMMKNPEKAKVIYPEMARDAVLFGGTDPGRFCPTYMIFCESFIPAKERRDPDFDRRDVVLITQNALADNTYLSYIRAHYNRSTQDDPMFFQNFLPYVAPKQFNGPTRALEWLDTIFESLGARIEKSRRAGSSYFHESDFTNLSALTGKLRKGDKQDSLSRFLYEKFSPETQGLLSGNGDEKTLRRALAKDLNVILEHGSIYEADRFKNIKLPVLIQRALKENPLPNTVIRLNRRMLEEAYPTELAKSEGGVFPDTEIHTPSPEESQVCFNDYLGDAGKRAEHDKNFPNEPAQIKQGEDVHFSADGRVQVSGQVAVMAINGLLTKVIFDKNPDHEFYVEESFPLDWMYPYLTPFGIIMKINRQPLPELTDDIVKKDHAFWSQYSERMIGNWVDYKTKVADICDWAEKVYLAHDFSNFEGDPKFLRDDNGQKAFSKLRSSIGGIYKWRYEQLIRNPTANPVEKQRMAKEAEFAFKQAFAYCPYSPEAVYRYVQLLLSLQRVDDALRIAKTCQKLDPFNGQIESMVKQLEGNQKATTTTTVQGYFDQINKHIQAKQTNEANAMLEQLLNHPQSDANVLMIIATKYLQIMNIPKAEQAIQKVLTLQPGSAENWYNLARLQCVQGKAPQALEALKKAIDLNAPQLKANPTGLNLKEQARTDPNFELIRKLPDFQKLLPPKK